MKYLIIISLVVGLWGQFNKIAHTNQLKADAANAFDEKDYIKSAKIYQDLITNYNLGDEIIRLNLANSLFLANERSKSTIHYQHLINSDNKETSSTAYQQLGMIAALKGKYDLALTNFKLALKTNDLNEKARYNYELIRKIRDQELDLQQEQQKQNKKDNTGKSEQKNSYIPGSDQQQETETKKLNQSSQQQTNIDNKANGNISSESLEGTKESQANQKDPSNKNEDKELEEDKKGNKDKESLKIKRLNEINISEEKARMILEMMKNDEIQYIQQMKKYESNKNYKDKPDW
jgi:hypothetical protein